MDTIRGWKAAPTKIFQMPSLSMPGTEINFLAMQRLPVLLEQVNASVAAWALLHDIELAEFDADLNTVGLTTKQGRRKPGYQGFKGLKSRWR